LKTVLKAAERFVIDNSPAIMTGIGVAGVITTAVLAGRASYSSALLLENALIEKRQHDRGMLTTREKVEVVWKEFIPPAVVGAITICAIVCANRVEARRAAALAAAFKVADEAQEMYRQKVIEAVGAKSEENIRAEVAHDQMRQQLASPTIIVTGGNHPFFDEFSGQFFESTMQRVQDAVNQINYQINQTNYAGLDEFYDLLGLARSDFSGEFGWNSDELLSIYHTAVLLDDGRAAVAIRYNTTPIRHYNKVR
jgi:hypothetical protein